VNSFDVREGERIYSTTCTACHGMTAQGVPGLGKTLIDSEFINSLTDNELVAFITVGRAITDPLNTTGSMMPGKGGNTMLTESDMRHVVAYIRSLNGTQITDDAPLTDEALALETLPTFSPATAMPTISNDTTTSSGAQGAGTFVAPDFNAIPADAVQGSGGSTAATAEPTPIGAGTFTPPDINAIPDGLVPDSGGVIATAMPTPMGAGANANPTFTAPDINAIPDGLVPGSGPAATPTP
jgi:cytochrome c553